MLIKHTRVLFAASGLPHSFIIMHQNRYQQCIGAFILQAASESNKVASPWPRGFVLTFPERNNLKCDTRYRNVHTSWIFFHFWCPFPERMDVKARGRCDYTVETWLRPAESQELHPVVGVRADMNHPQHKKKPSENTGVNVHSTVLTSILVLRAFCKICLLLLYCTINVM